MAHRLALAVGNAAQEIMTVNDVIETMNGVFKFYEKSTVKTENFRKVQVC